MESPIEVVRRFCLAWSALGVDVSEVFHPTAPGPSSSPTAQAAVPAGPRQITPHIARLPRSAILTATAGCCRRSRSGFRGASIPE